MQLCPVTKAKKGGGIVRKEYGVVSIVGEGEVVAKKEGYQVARQTRGIILTPLNPPLDRVGDRLIGSLS